MSTATFIKSDTTTQGTWYNGTTTVYGADGWAIADANAVMTNNPSWPSYATVTLSGESSYNWYNTSTAAYCLEYSPPGTSTGSDSKRIESTWYNSTSWTINVDITDGATHQVALYISGEDNNTIDETIQITDNNNNNAVLDTRTVSFTSNTQDVWMVWTISGNVTFTITNNGGPNADVSGIFFDPAPVSSIKIFQPLVSEPRFEPAFYE